VAPQRITITQTGFQPSRLTIRAGTLVTWTNADTSVHAVTSGVAGPVDPKTHKATPSPDGRFGSGDLKRAATYPFTFATPGTYTYYCSHHPEVLQGTVIVE
jgi:plastocyanin